MNEYRIDPTEGLTAKKPPIRSLFDRTWIDIDEPTKTARLSELNEDIDLSLLAEYVGRKFGNWEIEVKYSSKRSAKVSEIIAVHPKNGKLYFFRSIDPHCDEYCVDLVANEGDYTGANELGV